MRTFRLRIRVWNIGLRVVPPLLGLITRLVYWQPSSKPHRLYYAGRLTEVFWPGVSPNLYVLLLLYWLAVVSAIVLLLRLRMSEAAGWELVALLSTALLLAPVTRTAIVFTEAFATDVKGYFPILS